jgi:hypothetical protein
MGCTWCNSPLGCVDAISYCADVVPYTQCMFNGSLFPLSLFCFCSCNIIEYNILALVPLNFLHWSIMVFRYPCRRPVQRSGSSDILQRLPLSRHLCLVPEYAYRFHFSLTFSVLVPPQLHDHCDHYFDVSTNVTALTGHSQQGLLQSDCRSDELHEQHHILCGSVPYEYVIYHVSA